MITTSVKHDKYTSVYNTNFVVPKGRNSQNPVSFIKKSPGWLA